MAERLDAVRARIAAAGGTGVRVVAVTKGFGADAIEAAVAAGCPDVGENYAQELLAKVPAVRGPAPRVHFIGHLQTNKVKQLAPVVDVWQSVDRVAVVEALERHAAPGSEVLVQVNVSGAEQQGGCEPDEVRGAGGGGHRSPGSTSPGSWPSARTASRRRCGPGSACCAASSTTSDWPSARWA